jgi:hypothetical protein
VADTLRAWERIEATDDEGRRITVGFQLWLDDPHGWLIQMYDNRAGRDGRISRYWEGPNLLPSTLFVPAPLGTPAPPAEDEAMLLELLQAINQKVDDLMASIADLQARVAAQTTIDQSVVALLETLSADLKAAGTDPVALQAVIDTMDSNQAMLADAITANTPAAPAPAPAPTPDPNPAPTP